MRMYCSRIALIADMSPETPQQERQDSPIFFLTSGIQDVEESNLIVDHALFPV